MIRRRFALLLASLTLAACAASPTAVPVGHVTAAKFGDSKPVDWTGHAPHRFAVHGIDVARFQQSIDWPQARAHGVNFAFIKATEGGDRRDIMFDDHWEGAGRAGVARGAYHFYYFCTSPEDQARWFIRNVPRGSGDLPPVLDMEWNPLSPTCAHRRPPGNVVRDEMRRFLRLVSNHYGQRPIIYTTPKFYRENELDRFDGYDFWLRSTARTPAEVYPGQNWTFWQYTATGKVPGAVGAIDLNTFYGSHGDWAEWLARRRQ
ncbi:GH25 family lysozyme [Sulfitobacter aestuarii]|uniref:GH25 family lysozyme n=1 Tax=Sulfitobacter aestuarii TaxID=2161676 RepID=A0ABW5U2X8_9RHOB